MKPKFLASAALLLALLAAGSARAQVACPHPGAAPQMTAAVPTGAAPTLQDALWTPKPVWMTSGPDCCGQCLIEENACLAGCNGIHPLCQSGCYRAYDTCSFGCPFGHC